jgi:hypothetical protein
MIISKKISDILLELIHLRRNLIFPQELKDVKDRPFSLNIRKITDDEYEFYIINCDSAHIRFFLKIEILNDICECNIIGGIEHSQYYFDILSYDFEKILEIYFY